MKTPSAKRVLLSRRKEALPVLSKREQVKRMRAFYDAAPDHLLLLTINGTAVRPWKFDNNEDIAYAKRELTSRRSEAFKAEHELSETDFADDHWQTLFRIQNPEAA